MSPHYHVFLSHATADKPVVEYLARKLQEAGIEPFLDKWHLIPGRVWQTELAKGLQNSSACAIFVGSEGFGPWHTQEMLVALDRGARDPEFSVIPVLLPGFRRPDKIPEFLAQRTWVEFSKLEDEEAFHRLVCGIRGEIPEPGGEPAKPSHPYRSMAQAPEEFVSRSEYEKVIKVLCPKGDATQYGASIGITTALRGAGGFGKTVLAQKVCQDERVKENYPDGILWAEMKENADANSRLFQIRGLIEWWTQGKEKPAFDNNIVAASARLRELLNQSRVLLVIDDVWSSADITPFQGIGNGSALLITTRDSQTLPSGSNKIEVDAMASAEAVELLRSGLPDGKEGEFVSLATRLGEWPLLLKLVNRYLQDLAGQDGFTTAEALEKTRQALDKKGFSAFNLRDKEERHAAAGRTISVSIQRLSKEEAERYLQLAVFPEDADIPLSVLKRLWNIDADEAEEFCRRIYDLSLLLRFGRRSETIRLHDVVREILIEQIGDRLPTLHRYLLDTFRPASGLWSDLPVEEKYLWGSLAGHLLGAEQREELRQLVADFSFVQAKLNATDVNALITDYKPFAEDERELRLIQDALRLSAHVLARDRLQLSSQLFGRLAGHQGPSITNLLESAKSQLRFKPRQGSLTPAGGPLLRTLEGHSGWVNALAMVDGRRAISGSADQTLRLWDLETGETLRTFEGHSGWVNALAVVDGRRAVSGSFDGTLRVWDLETGEVLRTFTGHSDGVSALAVVDGRRVVSGSDDRTLRVWDLETGETLHILKGHSDEVRAIEVVDGRRIISGSSDGTLRIWDLETGETLRILEGHLSRVNAVAVLDDGCRAVSASDDRTLRVWDLETGETLHILRGHSNGVNALVIEDGRWAISGSDQMLWVWDLESGELLRTFKGHSGWIRALAMIGGRRIVSGSNDGTLRVWDLGTDEPLRPLERHLGLVSALAVVDDRRAVSGSYDGTLRVWDLETGETLQTLEGHSGAIRALAVVDGHWVVSGSSNKTLRVWHLETGETLRTLEGHSDGIRALAVMDGRRAISGSSDKTLRVWDLETGKTLRILEGHSGQVRAVGALDSRRVISVSDDQTLRVWDLKTAEILRTLIGHSGEVRALAIVDDHRVVSGSVDKTLRVWDLETGKTFRTLEGHSDCISGLAMMNGSRVVSSSYDRTVRVWDLETGETLAVMTLEASLGAVSVSPNGRIVVVGDQEGRVHFLDWVELE